MGWPLESGFSTMRTEGKENNVFSPTARLEAGVLSVHLQCKQYSVVCAEPRRGYVQAKRCLSMASPMFVLAWEQEKKAIWPHWKSKGCLKLKKKILVYFRLIFKAARRSPVPSRSCAGKRWPLLVCSKNRKPSQWGSELEGKAQEQLVAAVGLRWWGNIFGALVIK